MTNNQIIDILQDLTNKKHLYSEAQYKFAINYAITKIRSYNDLSYHYMKLMIDYAEYAEKTRHEIPLRDNY